MVFQEIYGKYYQTMGIILRTAAERCVTDQEIRQIVSEHAFQESTMYIPEAISNQWQLLDDSGRSVLKHPPELPLTLLEKRWLKSISLDLRIRLFQPDFHGLEDVEPMFTPDDFVFFDRYQDGDPYIDPTYIRNFRLLLRAIQEKREVRLVLDSSSQQLYFCIPYRLEYSEKDDRFRLLAVQNGHGMTLNLSKIQECTLLEQTQLPPHSLPKKRQLTLELTEERNTLERAMLHFSHFEKQAVRLDSDTYQITLWYEPRDEQEILIRVLSFGPTVRVISPDSVIQQLKRRIRAQMEAQSIHV